MHAAAAPFSFNPFDEATRRDPYALFARARREHPAWRHEGPRGAAACQQGGGRRRPIKGKERQRGADLGRGRRRATPVASTKKMVRLWNRNRFSWRVFRSRSSASACSNVSLTGSRGCAMAAMRRASVCHARLG